MSKLPPPPPAPGELAPTKANGWVRGALAFAVLVGAGVIPAALVVDTATSHDPTATGEASSTGWYALALLLVAAALATLTWAASGSATRPRRIITGSLVVAAVVWGFAAGFFGVLLVTFERHPTWDDA